MKRQIIKKWFWVWDFDREEAWLNDMAQSGWVLDKVGFAKYEFVQCQPGEYTVRLEMLEDTVTADKSQDYISFVEDLGAEYIGNVMKWVYFRKKASEGEFELFSDNASRIKYLGSVISLIAFVTIMNLFVGLYNLFLAVTYSSSVNYLGFLNLALGIFGALGVLRLFKKRKRMKEEGQLFE